MENRFDEIAKVLGGGHSRREAFRRVFGIVAGTLLANLGIAGGAHAQNPGGGGSTPPRDPCCPRLRVCAVDGPNAPPICCPEGTICIPVATGSGTVVGRCCRRDKVCGTEANGYTCCADGQVCSHGVCRCPRGTTTLPDGTCCRGKVCGSTAKPVCCPEGTVCVGGQCCPRSRLCGTPGAPPTICCPDGKVCRDGKCVCPTGTTPCGANACCHEGAVCISSSTTAAAFCCPRQKTIKTPNGLVCCPDGLVANAAHTACVCPGGTTACGPPGAVPFCCPEGTVCIDSDPTVAPRCCPSRRVIKVPGNDGTTHLACCPDGLVANADHTACGCPTGTVMTADGVCCHPKQVCGSSATGAIICCADGSKCDTNADGRPICVCPDGTPPCHSAEGFICCDQNSICLG